MSIITREQLEQVLSKPRNSTACVKLFSTADESNRRDLAPVAIVWYRSAIAAWLGRPLKTDAVLPAKEMPGFLINGISVAVLAVKSLLAIGQTPNLADAGRVGHELALKSRLVRVRRWMAMMNGTPSP